MFMKLQDGKVSKMKEPDTVSKSRVAFLAAVLSLVIWLHSTDIVLMAAFSTHRNLPPAGTVA